MTDSSEKDKVIRQIYYDADSGFGSITETYKASKKILNSITYDDVKELYHDKKLDNLKGIEGLIVMLQKNHYKKFKLILLILHGQQKQTEVYDIYL